MDHSVAYTDRPSEDSPDSPIAQSRTMLSKELARLRDIAVVLNERLAPVLGPIRALEMATELRPDSDEVSPMAASLADAAGGVSEQCELLEAIARRLEL